MHPPHRVRERRLFYLIFMLYLTSASIWLLLGLIPALVHFWPALDRELARMMVDSQRANWTLYLRWTRLAAANSHPPLSILFQYLFSVLNLGLGIALVRLRPDQWLARLLAVALVGTAAVYNLQAHALVDVMWEQDWSPLWVLHEFLHLAAGGSYMLGLLLFPTGTLPPWPWSRPRFPDWLARQLVGLLGIAAAAFGWLYIYLSHWEPAGYVAFFGILAPAVGFISLILRQRLPVDPEEREILRMWSFALLLAVAATGVIGLGVYLLTFSPLRPSTATQSAWEQLAFTLFPVLFTGIPVSLTFIVLRYRLWALQVAINRSLIYGALSTAIVALYILIVSSVDALLQGRWHWVASALAVGVVAVIVQPLRAWLQQEVDRLMVGDRTTLALQQSRQLLVNAREEERRRLRRDLHDGLGPQLASLGLKVNAARNSLQQAPEQSEAILQEVTAQIQSAITEIRRTVYDLRPPALDQLGLAAALQATADSLAGANGLHITVVGPDPMPSLPAAVEVAAYRIVLEALTNSVRHAQASRCQVGLCLSPDLHIAIEDNGRGFPAHVQQGVGLASMRERAEELGGAFTIRSKAGAGVRIEVDLPLPVAQPFSTTSKSSS